MCSACPLNFASAAGFMTGADKSKLEASRKTTTKWGDIAIEAGR